MRTVPDRKGKGSRGGGLGTENETLKQSNVRSTFSSSAPLTVPRLIIINYIRKNVGSKCWNCLFTIKHYRVSFKANIIKYSTHCFICKHIWTLAATRTFHAGQLKPTFTFHADQLKLTFNLCSMSRFRSGLAVKRLQLADCNIALGYSWLTAKFRVTLQLFRVTLWI